MELFLLFYILNPVASSLDHNHFLSVKEFIENRETFTFGENEDSKLNLWNHFRNQNSGGYFVYYSVGNEVPEDLKIMIKDFTEEITLNSCLVFSDIMVQER